MPNLFNRTRFMKRRIPILTLLQIDYSSWNQFIKCFDQFIHWNYFSTCILFLTILCLFAYLKRQDGSWWSPQSLCRRLIKPVHHKCFQIPKKSFLHGCRPLQDKDDVFLGTPHLHLLLLPELLRHHQYWGLSWLLKGAGLWDHLKIW